MPRAPFDVALRVVIRITDEISGVSVEANGNVHGPSDEVFKELDEKFQHALERLFRNARAPETLIDTTVTQLDVRKV
jgi:hypothetical protein